MSMVESFGLILAGVWGLFWAVFLQYVAVGRYLAARRAWITVVIGLGVDLAILAVLLPDHAPIILAVIAASSLGLITRSLWNEWRDHSAAIELAERHTPQERHDDQNPHR